MISDITYAKHAILAYSEPTHRVKNAAVHISVVDGHTLVSPAGTNDRLDVKADLKAYPWKPDELQRKGHPPVWVHGGFWGYTKKLIKPVLREIYLNGDEEPLPVAFSGHSLGAQASYMLACVCLLRGLTVANITTFGCPRGGFGAFNDLTRSVDGKRFVREGDQVTDVPFILGWSHDREPTMLEGSDGIVDHLMQDYLESL